MSQAEQKSLVKNRNCADSRRAAAPSKSGQHLASERRPGLAAASFDEVLLLSCSNHTPE